LALGLAAIGLMLGAPGHARASWVYANVRFDGEEYSGPVTFTAEAGERNRLTVRRGRRGVVFHDAGSIVRARGKCTSLAPHTATCGSPGYVSSISLGRGDDRMKLAADIGALAYGGRGDDRLAGGFEVMFFGGWGRDVLRGGREIDELDGGLGRDRLFGRGGDDNLIDSETDEHAARDVFDGGRTGPYGDSVDFSGRRHDLRIDLGTGRASTHDTIIGIEEIIGGAGDDRVIGDRADNVLTGGPGDDVLTGEAGHDIVLGGAGDDQVAGGDGDDTVWGNPGRDRIEGGAGDDLLESNEISEESRKGTADEVSCDEGADTAVSDATDMLDTACEQIWAGGAAFGTLPTLLGSTAVFSAGSAGAAAELTGTLAVASLEGDVFGVGNYDVPAQGTTTVSVPLSPVGVAALRTGTTVQVDVRPSADPSEQARGGYRMFLRVP
jgi:Ca2+-binding RTX toxin-like protein